MNMGGIGCQSQDTQEFVDGKQFVIFAEMIKDEKGIRPCEGHDFAKHIFVNERNMRPPLKLLVNASNLLKRPYIEFIYLCLYLQNNNWRKLGLVSLLTSKLSSSFRRFYGRLLR